MLLICGGGEDLRVSWPENRSNQPILKEINPEYSLEGLILRLKLQHFGLLILKANSLEKSLMLGKIEGRRWRRWQRMRWSNGITDSMGHESEQAPGIGDGQGHLACCSSWGHKESDTTEWLTWTDDDVTTGQGIGSSPSLRKIPSPVSCLFWGLGQSLRLSEPQFPHL